MSGPLNQCIYCECFFNATGQITCGSLSTYKHNAQIKTKSPIDYRPWKLPDPLNKCLIAGNYTY